MIDATYADPLGEAPARPKTAGRQRQQQVEDEFADEEIGDDLLPEWWSTSNVFSNQKISLTNLIFKRLQMNSYFCSKPDFNVQTFVVTGNA